MGLTMTGSFNVGDTLERNERPLETCSTCHRSSEQAAGSSEGVLLQVKEVVTGMSTFGARRRRNGTIGSDDN
jgi:hypothetical protein